MQENKTKRKREKRQIAQSEEKFKIMARQGMVKEYFSESKGIQNKAENIPPTRSFDFLLSQVSHSIG